MSSNPPSETDKAVAQLREDVFTDIAKFKQEVKKKNAAVIKAIDEHSNKAGFGTKISLSLQTTRPMVDNYFKVLDRKIKDIEALLEEKAWKQLLKQDPVAAKKSLDKLIARSLEDLERAHKAIQPIFKQADMNKLKFDDFCVSVKRFFNDIGKKIKTLFTRAKERKILQDTTPQQIQFETLRTTAKQQLGALKEESHQAKTTSQPKQSFGSSPEDYSDKPTTPASKSEEPEKLGVIFANEHRPPELKQGSANWFIRESNEPGLLTLTYLNKQGVTVNTRIYLDQNNTWNAVEVLSKTTSYGKQVFEQPQNPQRITPETGISPENMVALLDFAKTITKYDLDTCVRPTSSQASGLLVVSPQVETKPSQEESHYEEFSPPSELKSQKPK